MNRKIRVIIVDDSKTGRAFIAAALHRDSDIEIIGMASDPLEARDLIIKDQPDVITLDIEMPNMNGLQFLEKIMRMRPIPVVMVSSLTARGAETSVEALQLGAFDCFPKPAAFSGIDAYAGLVPIVRAAAGSMSGRNSSRNSSCSSKNSERRVVLPEVIAIGASTGGVEALGAILPRLPSVFPPVMITQHMPPLFTASLATRLNQMCDITVQEAEDGVPLENGHAYIAPGGNRHMHLKKMGGQLFASLDAGDPVSGHRPSVDELFRSVAHCSGASSVGVILTGMGRDGAEGLLEMRNAGAYTLGQNAASCVVYGMPKAAMEVGAVERMVPLGSMAEMLISYCKSENGGFV
ncbi:protein-glutamate methylesterase/protein-glutamine glutaminase [Acetobacter sp.]|jgi:two-component system chemotaxis response regulator CheB|uniref:protein-glutamate methylesterase/protein-glutamine glutaminase n=1 Tax=Acetobacter sp. TaxID=440 RepID=UPI0025C420A3|nr:chemotaxis response regulator protein-glutamate methylesterase [Acetobacter sp.]MCH4091022.1 chemotaxis response regulator protein-glutamate methylesterase [Acetobacter sp.]MCI1300205.1 chemotaxis response regulator protein-glutamate methylesterase [Acetobacter sp.]MCI1316127.1 chemotaxis response regulator protein-glutamate methylesterase [Acetobacter sp.]